MPRERPSHLPPTDTLLSRELLITPDGFKYKLEFPLMIGRAPDSNPSNSAEAAAINAELAALSTPDLQGVSHTHVKIEIWNPQIVFIPLGLNGTILDGKKRTEPRALQAGREYRLVLAGVAEYRIKTASDKSGVFISERIPSRLEVLLKENYREFSLPFFLGMGQRSPLAAELSAVPGVDYTEAKVFLKEGGVVLRVSVDRTLLTLGGIRLQKGQEVKLHDGSMVGVGRASYNVGVVKDKRTGVPRFFLSQLNVGR